MSFGSGKTFYRDYQLDERCVRILDSVVKNGNLSYVSFAAEQESDTALSGSWEIFPE